MSTNKSENFNYNKLCIRIKNILVYNICHRVVCHQIII